MTTFPCLPAFFSRGYGNLCRRGLEIRVDDSERGSSGFLVINGLYFIFIKSIAN
jgi:hypothetical protein